MILISRKGKASGVAAAWRMTYSRTGRWDTYNCSAESKYAQLVALGQYPTPEAVNEVIGNTSWTDVRCDECQKYVEVVVQLGEEPDYESATANVCKPCLIKAVGMAATIISEEGEQND